MFGLDWCPGAGREIAVVGASKKSGKGLAVEFTGTSLVEMERGTIARHSR